MRILAIDPGSEQSGYVVWNGEKPLISGVADNTQLLKIVGECLHGGMEIMALENVGHYGRGMPAGREVFDTCRWIGRFTQFWCDVCALNYESRAQNIYCVLRPSIKTHLCGSAKAKDANVRQAVIDRLGPPGTKKKPGPTHGVSSHAWQALALALYVDDMLKCGFELTRAA